MNEKWAEGIINIMREEGTYNNPSSIKIGVIKSISPLQIDLGGLPLNRENLYINKQLLDWIETVKATTSTDNNHTHSISVIEHKSVLNINDRVLLYPINGKYVVMGVIE